MSPRSEVVLIGGRSGVGKTSVAHEMHAQLSAAGVWHCLVEGDNLDLAYPPPWEHGLAERNLAMMWRNYQALGHHRLIYTNTVSVRFIDGLAAAIGDDPRVTAVLLTCSDATARQRLSRREIGTALRSHIARSDTAARQLEEAVPPTVARVDTDDRSTAGVAAEIIRLAGWTAAGIPRHSPGSCRRCPMWTSAGRTANASTSTPKVTPAACSRQALATAEPWESRGVR